MTPEKDTTRHPADPGRRALLGGALSATGGALAGFVGGRATAAEDGAGSAGAAGDAGPRARLDLDELVEPGRRRLLDLPGDAASPEAGASELGRTVVDARGRTQAGVLTSPPAHAAWVAFDLATGDRETLRRVMRIWTDSIDRLTAGRGTLTDTEPELAQLPASLTVTVGWGLGAYLAAGLDDHAPTWLAPLPPMDFDEMNPDYTDGELVLQVCADDLLTVRHAMRQLVEDARDLTLLRWQMSGYRHSAGVSRPGAPMRNLFGQVDGTGNPQAEELADLVHREDGSAAMVVRRVRFLMGTWEAAPQEIREQSIGRTLRTGAPLTGEKESDPLDLGAKGEDGKPVIHQNAHVRLARDGNPRHRFLRRPYNYDDGAGDVGQVFVAFCQDVDEQFVPILERIGSSDLLNEWLVHEGSAVFHVLPGVPVDDSGAYLGSHLLEA
ncbi:dye decolorizing peroxidase [Kytococcus aerolatus]|uniref:Dye decolorizing peroxidase n=1 Tax=Kytococcus aerolatus TaxID=592308 RepID=A0A212U5R2_9MICO|nr:Dyp-type peroxidase [Kytococcus aerolatus]SNC73546.1 dye decolorizing peroxidase [Kytococcus aerolatus]